MAIDAVPLARVRVSERLAYVAASFQDAECFNGHSCKVKRDMKRRFILTLCIVMCSGCGSSSPELSPTSIPGKFTWTHEGCFIDFLNDSGHDLEELEITFTFRFTDGSQQLRTEHWRRWANQETKHVHAVEKPGSYLLSVVGKGTSSTYRVRFGALLPDELDDADLSGTNQ